MGIGQLNPMRVEGIEDRTTKSELLAWAREEFERNRNVEDIVSGPLLDVPAKPALATGKSWVIGTHLPGKDQIRYLISVGPKSIS